MVVFLSFDKGTPIAIVEGGKYDGQIINIIDTDRFCCPKCNDKCTPKKPCCEMCNKVERQKIKNEDPLDLLDENYLRKKKKYLNAKQVALLRKALMTSVRPLEEDLAEVYDELKSVYNKKQDTEFVIHDGKLQLLPNIDPFQNHRVFIGAPSGAGKSTFAANYIKAYQKIYPKRNFYIISNVKEDKPLDVLKPLRLDIDESIIDNPIEKEELSNSVVLFDDFENFSNAKVTKQVATLRDQLLQEGRKEHIDVLICAHHLTNYKSTRTVLNECQYIVFFLASNTYGAKYLMKNYIGMSKQQIERVMGLPSRWVILKKDYPQAVIYESGMYLLRS